MVMEGCCRRTLEEQLNNSLFPHHEGCLCKVTSRQKSLKSSFIVCCPQNSQVFVENVLFPECRTEFV